MITCNLVSLKIQEELITHANDHRPQQIFQSHKALHMSFRNHSKPLMVCFTIFISLKCKVTVEVYIFQ